MRSIYLFLFLLIAIGAQGAGVVKLSGRIDKAKADSIEVSYNDNNLIYSPVKYAARLDKKGNFSLSFPVPAGVYTIVQLGCGSSLADIIVFPADSLVISADATRFDSTVNYKGRGGNIQNFIAAHTLQRGRINQYSVKVRASLQKEPGDFLRSMDNEFSTEAELLKKWKTPLPASFVSYMQAYYKYYNFFFTEQYPQIRQVMKLRRMTDTVPQENYDVVKTMPLAFNDSLLQVPSYLLYLTGALEAKLKASGYSFYMRDTLQMVAFEDSAYKLASTIMPPKTLEYYIAQGLYGRARTQRLARTEAQLAAFTKKWPNSEYAPMLNSQVAIARRLAPGQPAPDFDIRGEDGSRIKLSDLKGKVVYLTFWAGWCKPCVGEMINQRVVKDLIRKKPLVFVYASIGTDTAGERTLAEHYHIDGLFTNFKDNWNAREIKDYGVQSLPAFYLIDEDGKFAVQRTPLSGQTTELVMEIEKLFK